MQLLRHCVGKQNRESRTVVGGGEKWFLFVLNTVAMRAVSSYVNEDDSLEIEMIRRRDSPSCIALD